MMQIQAQAVVTVRVTVKLKAAVEDSTPHAELVKQLRERAMGEVDTALARGQVNVLKGPDATEVSAVTVTHTF